MRLALPNFVRRHTRLLFATLVAIAIAASTALALFGTFDPAFEGELWGARHELIPAGDDVSAGVVFVKASGETSSTLYVVERGIGTIVAYDSAGQIVAKPGAQWDTTAGASPVFGMELNQLAAAVVNVDGIDRNAILVSDSTTNRAVAFDTAGAYLFTLRLQRPTNAPTLQLQIGELAMSPGAKFTLTTSTQTLTLSGKFAAAWFEQIEAGSVDTGAMVFQGPTSFLKPGSEFEATPTAIKRTNDGDPVVPAPQRTAAVEFDTQGNLYVLDAFTERLTVFGPALNWLFTFGTPVGDGTTSAEFHEPWGMAFWPDAVGTSGRIFIGDTYKSRILVYRPIDTPLSAPGLDTLQLESIIKGFVALSPAFYSNAIALDPSSGSIAVTDYAEDEDVFYPRTIVLQQPNLATFDLKVLDSSGGVVQSVCTGSDYKIRFSLTVPPGRLPVTNVVPQLRVDGQLITDDPETAGTYPDPMTLATGEVATFTYSLTAPTAVGDLDVLAGATALTPDDLMADTLQRAGLVSLANCAGNLGPSTITATPSSPPQVSGWTPLFNDQTFSVMLAAADPDGIESVEYTLEGANESGEPIVTAFGGALSATLPVLFQEYGPTTLTYRVRDNKGIWSPLRTLNVRTKLVVDRSTNENDPINFRVGDPEGIGFTFSVTGKPLGITFDSGTGQFGGVVSFDASNPYSADPDVAAGIYHVVVTETSGSATSNVGFTWTVNNINRHPTIAPMLPSDIPPIVEGQPFTLHIDGHDPDGDPSFFTATGRSVPLGYDLPPSVAIDPYSGNISGTFPFNSEPSYTLTIGLSECAGTPNDHPIVCAGTQPRLGLATVTEITVNITNVNQPPAVNDPGPHANREGDTITPLQIVASDPDLSSGDVLEYLAGNLPPGLTIDSATGVISGTVGYDALPTYSVVVVVRDLAGVLPLPSVQFDWTITEAPPTVAAIPDRTDFEGDSFNSVPLQVVASDPGGGAVTYSASGLPHGLSINPASGEITGVVAFDAAGVHGVHVIVTHAAVSTEMSFNWTILDRNSPPTITAQDRSNAEGEVVVPVVVAPAQDAEGNTLTYSATNLPPGLTMFSNGVVSGTISPTGEGAYTVTVTVSDGVNPPVSVTFMWTVTSVNRPPAVSSGNRTSNEGDAVTAPISGSDPDNDPLVYTMTGLPATHSIDAQTGVITGTFSHQSAGVYTVEVTVNDGHATAATTFTWTVLDINRFPVVTSSNQFNLEGDPVSVQINGSDPDLDTLVWSATGLPPGLTLSQTGLITGTLGYETAGEHHVVVAVVDAVVGANTEFTWTVGNVNRPPTVTPIPDRSSAENDTVGLQVLALDPDGDLLLTYGAANLPPGLSINPSTGLISGTLTYAAAGVYNVAITVSDGNGPTGLTTVNFTWMITNVNRPPIVTNPDNQTGTEDVPIVPLQVTATDPDLGDTLTYSQNGLPAGLSIDVSTGLITGTPSFTSAGPHMVTVRATDQGGLFDEETFTWTITNVNRPPVVTNLNNQTGTEDVPIVPLQVTATDLDLGDTLTYSQSGLPDGLTIGLSTGLITGTPSFTSGGTHTVTVRATDQGGLFDEETFTWTITNVNRPPVVTNPDNQTGTEGAVISLPVIATDPDNDTLTYSATALPPGLSIDTATGVISGAIAYTASVPGTYTVKVTASDGSLSDSKTFTWIVSNTNRPPTVTALDRTNAENDTVSYATTASDPDANTTLAFSATNLPAGISINTGTGELTGTLDYTTAGTHNVTITVSDGTLTASAPFVWTVTNTNAPPVITSPGNLVNNEGEGISRQIVATDVDPQTLTFSATGLPPVLTISASGLITGTLSYASEGVYPFATVTVSDGVTTLSVTFTWTVNNVNRAPDVINPDTQNSFENTSPSLSIGASDPDGQILTYSATGLPPGLSINALTGVISGPLDYSSSGTYAVTVKVVDGTGADALSDSEKFTWNVTNVNRSPIAVADVATLIQGQSVVISVRSNDSDPDGDTLTITQVTQPPAGKGSVAITGLGTTLTYTAPLTVLGAVPFTYTISDGKGGTAIGNVIATVLASNLPPVCTAAAASPGALWPPNHKPVYITLGGVVDPDGGTPSIKFTSVLQDEPTNTQGDGNTTQDAGIENNGTKVWVRAERMGGENANVYGRVYIIGFTATDAQGAPCSGTVVVGVPHDQGNHNVPIPSPGRWNSITGALVVAPPPNANNDSLSTKKNTAKVVAVQANDVVYGAVTLSIASAPGSGTATVNANGTVTYTPAPNWTGSTRFTYRLTNGAGSDTAVVSVAVKK